MSGPAYYTSATTYEGAASETIVQFVPETALEREARRKRLLAEARVWRRIAQKIERWGLGGSGLCAEVDDCGRSDLLVDRLDRHRRGYLYLDYADGSYESLGSWKERTDARCLFACLLACEAEDEARSLTPLKKRSRSPQTTKEQKKTKNAQQEKRHG